MRQNLSTVIFVSFISAIIGGALVFGAIFFFAPVKSRVIEKEVIRERNMELDTKITSGFAPQQIYDKFNPAVVNVSSTRSGNDLFGFRGGNESATGSGFIISDDGLVITNEHVIDGAESVKVTLFDKSEFEAKVLGSDRSTDLALLQIEDYEKDIKPLKIDDSTDVEVGDTIYAIGNPLGLAGSMTSGIISNTDRTIDAPNGFQIRNAIQTDAAINRGNSGGPLLNVDGKVVGVSAQIATEGGSAGNIGIAFAIPSNTVKRVFNQIRDDGQVSHAWLGISGQDVTKKLAADVDLPVDKGALVVDVFEDSPASKAGLKGVNREGRGGDVIVRFGDDDVGSMEDLVISIENHSVGDDIKIEFYRDGKLTDKKIKLEERPNKDLRQS